MQVNEKKQVEYKHRLSHLEAQSLKINEIMDKSSSESQEFVTRLGTLKVMMVTLEEKLESQKVQWPAPGAVGGRPKDHADEETSGMQQNVGPDTVLKEINDHKSRENNIVIYGVPESESGEFRERIDQDKTFVKSFIQVCGVSVQEDEYKVYRLGRLNLDRKRPMLLRFVNANIKPALFRKLTNLHDKDEYKDIRVANDLTKKEREQEADLWRKAKNLTEEGQGKYRVAGPPWNRRVVRVAAGRGLQLTPTGQVVRPQQLT